MRYKIEGKIILEEYGFDDTDECLIEKPIIAQIKREYKLGPFDELGARRIFADNWRIISNDLDIDIQSEDFGDIIRDFLLAIDGSISDEIIPLKPEAVEVNTCPECGETKCSCRILNKDIPGPVEKNKGG